MNGISIPQWVFDDYGLDKRSVFSVFEATVDLTCLMADGSANITMGMLSDRWHWNRTRVMRMLDKMNSEGRIVLKKTRFGTEISAGDGVEKPVAVKKPRKKPAPKPSPEPQCNDLFPDTVIVPAYKSEHEKFIDWLAVSCPYISEHYVLLTEIEYNKLINSHELEAIKETCEQIENRIDLRKKYTNLYRTLLNWLKNYENENRRNNKTSDNPSDSELRQQSVRIIERLSTERRSRNAEVRK